MSLLPYLHRVCGRADLSAADARDAMDVILEGRASTAQVAAFLVALKMKGEAPSEILGFAQAMRARVDRVEVPGDTPLIDTCGTGGDGLSTFNISTVTAFVIAGAGVRVAKHGNRSFSSKCGSADVLEKLGVNLAVNSAQVAACIRETGIGFLFAQALHPAMKHAGPARAELKMRTAFNLLGPLTNPAGARYQLLGAPSETAARLISAALAGLGTSHAFVVHGYDGLDEISTTGPTLVCEVRDQAVSEHTWEPRDFGVRRAHMDDLAGGDPEENAAITRRILAGASGPARDIVLVNAAAALVAAGAAADPKAGVRVAADSIDTGAAARCLDRLTAFTQGTLQAGTKSTQ